jgi:hypothetical protein
MLAIALDPIMNSFIDAKNRGIKLRCLNEITCENISYCKELNSIVGELRHLEGIKATVRLCCFKIGVYYFSVISIGKLGILRKKVEAEKYTLLSP